MNFAKRALASAVLFGLVALPAQAEIEVDVDISVGAITILYAFDDIDVDINSTALAALINAGAGCTVNAPAVGNLEDLDCAAGDAGTVTAAELAGALDATPTNSIVTAAGALGLNSVDLTLNDVWAVRAIGGTSANTTVGVTLGGDNVLTNGASAITVNSVSIPAGATFADPGLGAPQTGDVLLNLDLSAVTASGNHDNGNDAADVVYTIAVTAT